MSKNQIKYLIILIFGLALFILAEMNIQDPIDWRMTYNKKDKIPYGTYVLYDVLPDLFPNKKIKINKKSFYEFYKSIDSNNVYNYFIINNTVEIDKASTDALINFVSKGNNAFIVANEISKNLKDTLNITINSWYDVDDKDTTSTISLVNPKLKKLNNYLFISKLFKRYFETYKKENFKILGLGEDGKPNFAKISVGKGNVYINLQPLVYTNFHILNSDKDYISNSLSYLNPQTFIWDEYYKSYRTIDQTPMRYFISRPALKFAFYLFMFILFVYLIFEYKREQRFIPIINPPKNDSANFVKTIGQLHFLKKDYTNISHQKINLFLEKIREKYYLKTNKLDEEFCIQLQAKSNKPIEKIKELFNFIQLIKSKQNVSETELVELNRKIEDFRF